MQATLKNGDPTNADFYIGILEYIPHYANQMRDFEAHAGHQFVLASPGHPDLHATLSGTKLSNEAQYQMWGVCIAEILRFAGWTLRMTRAVPEGKCSYD